MLGRDDVKPHCPERTNATAHSRYTQQRQQRTTAAAPQQQFKKIEVFVLRVLLVHGDLYCSYSQYSQCLVCQYCSYSQYSRCSAASTAIGRTKCTRYSQHTRRGYDYILGASVEPYHNLYRPQNNLLQPTEEPSKHSGTAAAASAVSSDTASSCRNTLAEPSHIRGGSASTAVTFSRSGKGLPGETKQGKSSSGSLPLPLQLTKNNGLTRRDGLKPTDISYH